MGQINIIQQKKKHIHNVQPSWSCIETTTKKIGKEKRKERKNTQQLIFFFFVIFECEIMIFAAINCSLLGFLFLFKIYISQCVTQFSYFNSTTMRCCECIFVYIAVKYNRRHVTEHMLSCRAADGFLSDETKINLLHRSIVRCHLT